MLPPFGPCTVRDSPVYLFQIATNALMWVDMPVRGQVTLGVTATVDGRSRAYQVTLFRDQAAIDLTDNHAAPKTDLVITLP